MKTRIVPSTELSATSLAAETYVLSKSEQALRKADLVAPSVHPNGTGGDDLYTQYATGADALRVAIDAIPRPHARDYYVQGGDAFERARRQYERHVTRLRAALDDLCLIQENVQDQRDT